jgi:hypothetical protein
MAITEEGGSSGPRMANENLYAVWPLGKRRGVLKL